MQSSNKRSTFEALAYIIREDEDGRRYYDQQGRLHRIGGPAVDLKGYKAYYKHGLLHNLDGPAAISHTDRKAWYIDGENLTEEQFLVMTQPK